MPKIRINQNHFTMWQKFTAWVAANLGRSLIFFNLLLVVALVITLFRLLNEAQADYLKQPSALLETPGDTAAAEKKAKSIAAPSDTANISDTVNVAADTTSAEEAPAATPPAKVVKKAPASPGVTFVDVLLLMLTAGCLGGVLCNLRGFFEYYRDQKKFPEELILPYFVRPFSAAVCGLFAYFIASLLVVSITVEQVASQVSFQGMVSFMALGIMAGFGAQEFMERMKATVRSLFGQKEAADKMAQLEKLFQLNKTGVLTDDEFAQEKKKLMEAADVSLDRKALIRE